MVVQFGVVGKPVLVDILISVVDSILVGVGVRWVGAKLDLLGVGQPVTVCIDQGGIGFVELDFVGVNEAISVCVSQVWVGFINIYFGAVT